MATTADPNEVIQLPRLRPGDLGTLMLELASTARATITHLEALAKPSKKRPSTGDETADAALPAAVPERVIEALGDLETARPTLVDALRAGGVSTTLTPGQRALDTKMNAAWRCVRLTYELGEQHATALGDDALAERCVKGRARVLPQGIAFISLVGRDEYTMSDRSLGLLEGEQAALFRALPGGAALLREVRAVHDQYGEAFHITVAAPAGKPETPGVARAVTDAAAAAREYIAAVIGSVRRADPRTRALADRLLAPLAHYGRATSAPSETADGAVTSGKAPPVTPDAPID